MDELREGVCPVCGEKEDLPLVARVVGYLVVISLGLLSVSLVLAAAVWLFRWTF